MVSITFMVNFYYIYGWYYIYGFYYIYGWYNWFETKENYSEDNMCEQFP